MARKLFYTEYIDYRKIFHFLGLKISLGKNHNRELLDKINFLQEKISKFELENKFQQTLICASSLHKQVFSKYKNINQEKNVVLIATGPSLKDFKPVENAIYVGVNKAFQYDKVKFDYLFLQDYSGATKTYIEDFCNYDAKKFIGYLPDYIWEGCNNCIIPEKYSYYKDVERYYIAHPDLKKGFTFDISSLPIGDAYSIAFPAMQFILWTNPKKIYLVGCDCSLDGYHNSKDKNNLAVEKVIEAWKKMKNFASWYYPDTEIISINPVGLKGVFKDEVQK